MRPETFSPTVMNSDGANLSQKETSSSLRMWAHNQLDFLDEREASANIESLLVAATGKTKHELYLASKQPVEDKAVALFKQFVTQRKRRIPLAYVIRQAYFWNEVLEIREGCLIPRPETELLIEKFIEKKFFSPESEFRFLDLCSGSGAIAVALLGQFRYAQATLIDLSKPALAVSRANIAKYGFGDRAEIIEADLFQGCEGRRWDVIVSNPPYVARTDWRTLEPELYCEPFMALDGGMDGLDFYRQLIPQAPEHLNANGWIFLEMGLGQSAAISEMLIKQGFDVIEIFKDLSGVERIAVAQLKV